MTKVKICGITNAKDALKAAELGADFLGFIFVPDTPRHILPDVASSIIKRVREAGYEDIIFTGLFIDAEIDKVMDIVNKTGINCLQLHGREVPGYCDKIKKRNEKIKIIKTFKVDDKIMDIDGNNTDDYMQVDFLLFDTYHQVFPGGTGEKFNLDVVDKNKNNFKKLFFIAGGLTSSNVEDAIKQVSPYAVDVSSGVEKEKGYKDHNLLKEFIQNAKKST